MKNTTTKTPKPYLSWSQLWLWEQSPKYYAQRYFEGRDLTFLSNLFGSEMAKALEDNDMANPDPALAQAMIFLPKYPLREHRIEIGGTNCPLLGSLDGYDPKGPDIGEYKSGKIEWTQAKVNKHGQLDFYSLLVYLKEGKLPRKVMLHYFCTNQKHYGRVFSFEKKITLTDVLRMSGRATKAWKEIKEAYKRYGKQ